MFLTLIIVLGLFSLDLPLQVNQDLAKVGFTSQDTYADQKLKELKLDLPPPAIFKVKDPIQRAALNHALKATSAKPQSLIKKIQTFENILPNDQEDKIILIEEIRDMLSPKVMSQLKGNTLTNAKIIQEAITLEPITLSDLPQSFKKRFQGKNQGLGEYTFVFPKHNTNDGELNRQFAQEVRQIQLGTTQLYSTGKSILIADYLDSTLPVIPQVVLWAILGITLLLSFEISLKDALSVSFCVGLALGFGLVLLQFFEIALTPLNVLLFPLILGYCFDGVLHIHQRYREEATGSLPFVLRRTGAAVIAATLTTAAGFLGFALSKHPGLASIGYFALIGTLCSLIASIIFVPTLIGWGDLLRWRKQQKLVQ